MLKIGNIYYPSEFKKEYIKAHFNFEEDLKDLLEGSGFKEDFSGKYKARLTHLEMTKEGCTQRSAWFEKLKGVRDLYSIRFDKSQKNIRILFAFVAYKGEKFAVLLYVFEEKGNKRLSKQSYDKAIPVALKRLKEVTDND